MKKLIGIARVSTEEQAGDNGEGLQRQRDEITLIAKRQGIPLIKIVDIVDVSGSDVAKSSEWLQEVLPSIQAPETHLAIDSMDRLIRASTFDAFAVLAACQTTGTKVFTPTGMQDFSKPEDVLSSGILALIGGKEKAEIKRRMNAGKEAKRRRGGWVSGATMVPLGFLYNKKAEAWSTTPDLARVQRAYHDLADGVPIASVAKTLGYADGNTRKILRNPIYKGLLVWDKKVGEPIRAQKNGKQVIKRLVDREPEAVITVRILPEDQQPVSDALWQTVQGTLAAIRGRRLSRKSAAQGYCWATGHLSDNDIFKGKTGMFTFGGNDPLPKAKRLFGHEHDDGHWRYHVAGGDWSLHADRLNHALDRYLAELCDGEFQRLALEAATKKEAQADEVDLPGIERQIVSLKKRQDKLVDAFDQDAIDLPTLKTRTSVIKKEIALLEQKRDAPKPVAVPTVAAVDAVSALNWNPEATAADKRAWLARYSVDIFLTQDAIEGCSLRVRAGGEMGVTFMGGHFRSLDDLLVDFRPKHRQSWLSTTEVAGLLGVKPSTLRKWCRNGKVASPAKVGMDRRWHDADIEAARAAVGLLG